MYQDETLDQVYITTESGDTFLLEISEGASRRFTKISIPQINFEYELENESLIELSEALLNLFDNLE
tara:strand:+ start:201 stop:401 length:201 start_codon:yes stop_codon:yes gene_type:complete